LGVLVGAELAQEFKVFRASAGSGGSDNFKLFHDLAGFVCPVAEAEI
jgi:hypothetical protein